MSNRREFITLLGGATIAWPLAARAQQLPRVGVLVSLSAPHPFNEAFRSGMRDLGYVEGRNIAIEWRYADAQFSRAVELAAELVRLQVDVIAAYHTPAVKAAMNATKTIPIVMAPADAPRHSSTKFSRVLSPPNCRSSALQRRQKKLLRFARRTRGFRPPDAIAPLTQATHSVSCELDHEGE
jgi:hypothetical protein